MWSGLKMIDLSLIQFSYIVLNKSAMLPGFTRHTREEPFSGDLLLTDH